MLRDIISAKYGNCRICSLPIVHAGLDHNFCFKCGWVMDLQWHQTQLGKKQKKTNRQ